MANYHRKQNYTLGFPDFKIYNNYRNNMRKSKIKLS